MDRRRDWCRSLRRDLAGLELVVPPTVFALGVRTVGAWSGRCRQLRGRGGGLLQEPAQRLDGIRSASADRSAIVARGP